MFLNLFISVRNYIYRNSRLLNLFESYRNVPNRISTVPDLLFEIVYQYINLIQYQVYTNFKRFVDLMFFLSNNRNLLKGALETSLLLMCNFTFNDRINLFTSFCKSIFWYMQLSLFWDCSPYPKWMNILIFKNKFL